jgi:hypothetical protein
MGEFRARSTGRRVAVCAAAVALAGTAGVLLAPSAAQAHANIWH